MRHKGQNTPGLHALHCLQAAQASEPPAHPGRPAGLQASRSRQGPRTQAFGWELSIAAHVRRDQLGHTTMPTPESQHSVLSLLQAFQPGQPMQSSKRSMAPELICHCPVPARCGRMPATKAHARAGLAAGKRLSGCQAHPPRRSHGLRAAVPPQRIAVGGGAGLAAR